jgi:hypothetical protein
MVLFIKNSNVLIPTINLRQNQHYLPRMERRLNWILMMDSFNANFFKTLVSGFYFESL